MSLSTEIISTTLTSVLSDERIFSMLGEAIHFKQVPKLHDPLFIAGFEGWGNALDVSTGTVDYLIRKLEAKAVAQLNPDYFYHFDENRPLVNIKEGILSDLLPPSGTFYATQGSSGARDLLLFHLSLSCIRPVASL